MASRYNRRKHRNVLFKLFLVCVLFVIAAVDIWHGVMLFDQQQPVVYGDLDARFGKEYISYKGASYRPRTGLSTFLLMGVDQRENVQSNVSFRSGGQADFLQLVVIDTQAKAIRRIQIDRDTMAEITVLGVLGNELGTSTQQICLAHGFGDGQELSCRYTVEAVSRLLFGIEIDGYYALNMSGIPVFNELLGGVTVQVDDDFSEHDPAMFPGAVVTLNGEQAELFVRSRMTIGDGTNESRMRRQQQYLSSALVLAAERLQQDDQFLAVMLEGLAPYAVTDISRGRMINESNKANRYDIQETISLQGEYIIGEDGFVEFHADSDSLKQCVLQLFYEPVLL